MMTRMPPYFELWERAKAIAGTLPDRYIFPACQNGQIDPERHQRSWRTAWRNMTRAVFCQKCRELQDPAKNCRLCGAEMTEIKSPLAVCGSTTCAIMPLRSWRNPD